MKYIFEIPCAFYQRFLWFLLVFPPFCKTWLNNGEIAYHCSKLLYTQIPANKEGKHCSTNICFELLLKICSFYSVKLLFFLFDQTFFSRRGRNIFSRLLALFTKDFYFFLLVFPPFCKTGLNNGEIDYHWSKLWYTQIPANKKGKHCSTNICFELLLKICAFYRVKLFLFV